MVGQSLSYLYGTTKLGDILLHLYSRIGVLEYKPDTLSLSYPTQRCRWFMFSRVLQISGYPWNMWVFSFPSKHNTRKMPRSWQRINISCTTESFLPAGYDCAWMRTGSSSPQIYRNRYRKKPLQCRVTQQAESDRFSDTRDMDHAQVHIKTQLKEQVDVAVTNIFRRSSVYISAWTPAIYLGSGSSHFSSVRPGKCQDITVIRSWPLHPRSVHVHQYSLVIFHSTL